VYLATFPSGREINPAHRRERIRMTPAESDANLPERCWCVAEYARARDRFQTIPGTEEGLHVAGLGPDEHVEIYWLNRQPVKGGCPTTHDKKLNAFLVQRLKESPFVICEVAQASQTAIQSSSGGESQAAASLGTLPAAASVKWDNFA
jgi:hypothetical protein